MLREKHEEIYGSRIGTKALVTRVIRYGYYWPSTKENSINFVKICNKCQIHANEHHILMTEYHIFGTPIPFAHWRIDLFGLFPKATTRKNHLFVAIDHFTRWIDVKIFSKYYGKKGLRNSFMTMSFSDLVFLKY